MQISNLSYEFTDGKLLEQALTHKSFCHEAGLREGDNERLEFLGDAVLDLLISDLLMRKFNQDNEGHLSRKRASLVNEDALCQIAKHIELHEIIRLGKGERQSGGVHKPRILASALEALIGAVYLDSSYERVMSVFAPLFAEKVFALEGILDVQGDYKTKLQEKIQQRFRMAPTYRIEKELGPDHDKVFEVSVIIAGETWASGSGRSKKAAEQEAARRALDKAELELQDNPEASEPEDISEKFIAQSGINRAGAL